MMHRLAIWEQYGSNKGSKVVPHKKKKGAGPEKVLGPGIEETAAAARELGMALDGKQASHLAVYLGLLTRWNKAMNLVGPRHWRDIMGELVTDSMHLAEVLCEAHLPEDPLALDLGAGAGIPGIPLRILWPRGRVPARGAAGQAEHCSSGGFWPLFRLGAPPYSRATPRIFWLRNGRTPW